MASFRFSRRPVAAAGPVAPPANVMTLVATYPSAPAATAAFTAAKANTSAVLLMETDDGGLGPFLVIRDFFRTLSLSDNAGGTMRPRQTLAQFLTNMGTGTELGDGTDASKTTYAQLAEAITLDGWDISNHSRTHENGSTEAYFTASVGDAQDAFTARLAAVGLPGYVARTFTVPTNYSGYVPAAYARPEMLAVGSQGTGYSGPLGSFPAFPQYNDEPWLMSAEPAARTFVMRRFFLKDVLDSGTIATATTYINTILTGTPTAPKVARLFSHGAAPEADYKALVNHAISNGAGKLWMPTFREYEEWKEVKRLSVLSTSVSGNVLTVTIDQKALPAYCRHRDASLLVPAGFTSVTATGADRLTSNAATGLVNLWRDALVTPPTEPPATTYPAQVGPAFKMAFDTRYSFTDSDVPDGIEGLHDGDYDTNANFGFKAQSEVWNVFEVFRKEYNTRLDYLELTDKGDAANGTTTKPIKIYARRRDRSPEIYLGEFDGSGFDYIKRLDLPANFYPWYIRWEVTGAVAVWPTQADQFGRNTAFVEPAAVADSLPFRTGVNCNLYDFTNLGAQNYGAIDPVKAAKVLAFGIPRIYDDQNDNIQQEAHEYTGVVSEVWRVNPDHKGMRKDAVLACIKDAGQEAQLEMINNRERFGLTFPAQDHQGRTTTPINTVPREFGSNPESPAAYVGIGQHTRQWGLRYGTGAQPSELADVKYPDYPKFNYEYVPERLLNLNLLKGFGLLNEQTLGHTAYRYIRNREYAPLWSVAYDGHLGTVPGTGAAQYGLDVWLMADFDPNDRWLLGLEHFMGELRGWKANGRANFPLKRITIHAYFRHPTTYAGIPYEADLHQQKHLRRYIAACKYLFPGVEIWLTEMGYADVPQATGTDANNNDVQGYSYVAPGNGLSTVERIGAWNVRNVLVLTADGVAVTQYYTFNLIAQLDPNLPKFEPFPKWDRVCKVADTPTQYFTQQIAGLLAGCKFVSYVLNKELDLTKPTVQLWSDGAGKNYHIAWHAAGSGTYAAPANTGYYTLDPTSPGPVLHGATGSIALGEVPCLVRLAA